MMILGSMVAVIVVLVLAGGILQETYFRGKLKEILPYGQPYEMVFR